MPRAGLPALTGIRAVACTWVMLSHVAMGLRPGMAPWLQALTLPGYLGVDLFFILSGFILLRVHDDLPFTASGIAAFFVKRLFRVYPLDFAILLLMALDAWSLGLLGTDWYDWEKFPFVALMIQPYFTNPPIVGWLATNWTVGIELLCYLLFPLVAFAIRNSHRILLAGALAVVVLAEAWTQRHYLGAFYGQGAILRGICGFSLGALCAALASASSRPRCWIIAGLNAAALAATILLLLQDMLWPIPLLMAVAITMLSYQADPFAALLGTAVAVWLGDISFSLYLVHGVVLGNHAWDWLAQIRTVLPAPFALAAWGVVFAASVLLISAVTYYGVERPCRAYGSRQARRLSAAGQPRARTPIDASGGGPYKPPPAKPRRMAVRVDRAHPERLP